ncbi:AMP-binding protein [Pseudonocardia endophytica]|uniref:Fatty-acyl-CoA synthase n=1 Tax=Pseudonocardia endophytica TaxID=401976 RepID=A0A4R1HMH5_PSEEN|nr:AMP-binding protein [Pseudonocardia endophytica]TCK22243.1 fatty-acyl-CoA synthase [Pseudonocardia endophytica]
MSADVHDFATWFERIADLAPDRPAVLCGDRTLTWAELDARADRLAGYLDARGVAAGDRFGLAARNGPEYPVALVALLKLGATPVNVNHRYQAAEMAHVLATSGARGAVAEADLAATVAEAGAGVVVTVDPSSASGFGACVDAAEALPRRSRGDTEWVLYTGGTTGAPKAVLGRQSERLRAARGGFATLGLDAADPEAALRAAVARDPYGPDGMVHLPAAPLMHGTGLYAALGALTVAAPLALLPERSITGEGLVAAIARHGVTDLTLVGDAVALRLLDALDDAAARGRDPGIGGLRRIRSIGAVWSPPVKRRLLAHADVTLLDTVAASEGGVYAHSVLTRASSDREIGTFVLAPGARLLDPDHAGARDVPPGSDAVGVLAAPVGPRAGYEGDAGSTAFRDLDGGRWSVPGDMARIGPDGRLTLLGRGSQVINTGGEKVYADEVELVLREHPQVRDVTVLGVPDERWGSVVGAVVALDAGGTATPDELAAFVGDRLAGYKKPRRIVLVDEVHRLVTGKSDLRWAARTLAPAAHPAR